MSVTPRCPLKGNVIWKLEPLFYALTFQILHSSKTALPWPIYLIEKTSPTNSGVAVNLTWELKGFNAPIYLEFAPNFALKQHYSPTAHRSLNQILSNLGGSKKSFMKKLTSVMSAWETYEYEYEYEYENLFIHG